MSWNRNASGYVYRIHQPEQRKKDPVVPRISFSSEQIEPVRFDLLSALVAAGLSDVLEDVILARMMPPRELFLIGTVCQAWKTVLDRAKTTIWKRHLNRRLSQDVGLKKIISSQMHPRDAMKRVLALDVRWRSATPLENRVECDSFVLSIIIVDSCIVVGLNNGCIEELIAKDRTYDRTRRKECHSKGVRCLTSWSGRIASGSYDSTIKIHRWDNWHTLAVLQYHSQAVWEIRSLRGLLASCGLDGRVVVANLKGDNDAKPLYELSVPCETSVSVELTDTMHLLAGGDGGEVNVFDVGDGTQVSALKPGHRRGVTAIRAWENIAATAGCDRDVRLWNFITGVCIMICKGHRDLVRCLDINGSRMVSADFVGFVKIWDLIDLREGNHDDDPQELLSHRSMLSHRTQVTAVAADPTRVVSGSRDRTVLIVDFDKSGEDPKIARRRRRRAYF